MFFGCEQGRRWVRRRQEAWANSRWATRKIDCKQIRRITWHLSPRRGEPDLKTGESLFISLPVSWKSLGTLSASPNFVTLIQHVRQLSPGDGCRDVHWSKFVGTGKERNAFPFKKDLSLSPFFCFFSFLERVFPLFPIFLGISHPVLRRSFPVFSSFHLSKPVPCFLMVLKLAILERVLNENLSKPVPCRSWKHSLPFLKSFLVFPQPVFLSNKEKREPRTASVLKGYTLASV